MTILAVISMASCRGPKGDPGNANVSSSTVTIKSSDWQWQSQYGQWMVEIDYPAINNNVYNYGAVLVYMDVDGTWSQVPLTYYYQDYITDEEGQEVVINCAASIEVATLNDGGLRLFWTESDFYDGYQPQTRDYKIVAIEATVFESRSDVDYSSYEAVKTAFQLTDDK